MVTAALAVYVTVSPCVNCARLLIASGISAVHTLEYYRDPAGVDALNDSLIPCYLYES